MKNKKIAIITGASRGIGKAIALKLDKKGFITILVSHNQENLKKTLKEFSKNAVIIKADISKEKDVILMFKKVIKKFKNIDILVNNAGFSIFKEIEQIKKKDFDKMIGVNVAGVFYCIRECIKQMRKQKNRGQIINIGSVASKSPFFFPERSLYCSVKAAISALADSVQRELEKKRYNIKIATIYPGCVFTEWTKSLNNRKYGDLKKYALKTSDIVHAVLMIIGQGENSNITEIVIRPIISVSTKK